MCVEICVSSEKHDWQTLQHSSAFLPLELKRLSGFWSTTGRSDLLCQYVFTKYLWCVRCTTTAAWLSQASGWFPGTETAVVLLRHSWRCSLPISAEWFGMLQVGLGRVSIQALKEKSESWQLRESHPCFAEGYGHWLCCWANFSLVLL